MPPEKSVDEVALVLEIWLVDIRADEVNGVAGHKAGDDDGEEHRT